MRRYEDERSEDEIEAAYEDESDRDDRLYHQTKENMLAPRSEWGPNEWRLAQIEGRLEPQRGEKTMTATTRYEAEFQPQAWINDNAITVDAEGPTTWDATEFVLDADPEWRKVTLERGADYDDILRTDENAPEWVREWHGPFETYLREK